MNVQVSSSVSSDTAHRLQAMRESLALQRQNAAKRWQQASTRTAITTPSTARHSPPTTPSGFFARKLEKEDL